MELAAKPHIVILGAGPAGLGAVYQLSRKGLASVSVLEQSDRIGGNAGSFEISGVRVDYGSHRLHPACDPKILEDIRDLLGGDLLERPRHGRIRLRERWLHFPLKLFDLGFNLPPSFAVGTGVDLMRRFLPGGDRAAQDDSFASLLERGLGKTICRDFYFPYAEKIWGLPPQELAASQARRRVSASSIGKMILKVLSAVPGLKESQKACFFYPKQGFGQISERLCQSSKNLGARFILGAEIESIRWDGNTVGEIRFLNGGQVVSERLDYLWTTIPVPGLLNYFRPLPPPLVLKACNSLVYRGMILVYLSIEQERFSEYDAHYFPERNIRISRLSEPKNYADVREPLDRTVLCAEIPCWISDPEWQLTDEELGTLVLRSLESAGLPITVPINRVKTQRLSHAYPVYRRGYEVYFNRIDQWLDQMENVVNFGRQGLFIHDNTHHALSMAYTAVNCLDGNGSFDRALWKVLKKGFETFVVED